MKINELSKEVYKKGKENKYLKTTNNTPIIAMNRQVMEENTVI